MIGVEARLTATLNPGTVNQQTTNYGAANQVIYFSVDGSPGDAAAHRGGYGKLQRLPRLPGGPRRSAQQRDVLRDMPQPGEHGLHHAALVHRSRPESRAQPGDQLRPDGAQDPHRRQPGELQRHLYRGGPRRGALQFRQRAVPADGAHRGHARHRPMLHVPRQQLRSGLPHRQEPGHRSARAVESGAGHHFGLHGLPLEHLRHGARGLSNRSQDSARAAMFATPRAPPSTCCRSTPASRI